VDDFDEIATPSCGDSKIISFADSHFAGCDRGEVFEELFLHELDSWFSADIACCDACYDAFVSQWPGIYLQDIEFRENGWPLTAIYAGSRLSEVFSEAEFEELLPHILCPACGSPLQSNIWPYSLPFNVPEGFLERAGETERIADNSPFLMLKNDFAREVFKQLEEISADVSAQRLVVAYFRARRSADVESVLPDRFAPPPAAVTSEGRYNHAGHPVLYLGDSIETCYHELGRPPLGIIAAEVIVLQPMRVLDLRLAKLNNDIIEALVASSLLSSTVGEGLYHPAYTFSRFVADCLRYLTIDGLKYGSVRSGGAHNLVLFSRRRDWTGLYRIEKYWTYDGSVAREAVEGANVHH